MMPEHQIATQETESPPSGYRMTELGPLPKEWRVVRLGEVVSLTMGQSPPSLTYNTSGVGLPFLQGKAEFGEVYPTPVKWSSQPKKVAPRGSILISVRAPVGDVNLAKEDYCIGRGLAAINGNEALNNWFLFYLLIFTKRRLEDNGTGSTFKSINKGVLQNFVIPLPSLPEQRAIAHVLRTVQEAREATERVIAALRELKKSLMRHLFTYGPVPVGARHAVPLQETEIGPLPAHWRVVKLGEVVEVRGGKRLPKGHKFAQMQTPYPYIRVTDFSRGKIRTENLKYLTEKDHKILERYTISADDAYISIAGTIGLVGIIPRELDGAHLTENAAKLVIVEKKDLEQQYLMYSLMSAPSQEQMHKRATKTSQPKLALTRIRSLSIPLPPLSEQREIARILQAVDARIEAEERKETALEALFKSLLYHLMTAKIRLPKELVGAGSEPAPTEPSDDRRDTRHPDKMEAPDAPL